MADQPIDRQAYLEQPSRIQGDLLKYLDPDESLVIFDIGSCEGEDSYKYARLFPNARVFAFEPLPGNFQRIEKLIEDKHLSGRISAHPYALSNRTGKANFHVSSGIPPGKETGDWDYGNKSSSLLPPGDVLATHEWLKFDKNIEVMTVTLEKFCRDENIGHIDFIHMDVQGAELDVLQGAGRLLETLRVIWMEVHTETLYKDQPLKNEVEDFMSRHNFSKRKDTAKKIAGDQLYVKNTFKHRSLLTRLWQTVAGTS